MSTEGVGQSSSSGQDPQRKSTRAAAERNAYEVDRSSNDSGSRSSTPRPTIQSVSIDEEGHSCFTSAETVQTAQTLEHHPSKRPRHNSLSIHNLIEGDVATTNASQRSNSTIATLATDRCTIGRKMEFGVPPQHMAAGMMHTSAQSSPHDSHSHNSSFGSQFGGPSDHPACTAIDHESLAALADASKAASLDHEGQYAYTEDLTGISPYADLSSRASSAFSLHSSLSNYAQSDDLHSRFAHLPSMATGEGMNAVRERSGTLRRFKSLSSTSSAPTGLGVRQGDFGTSPHLSLFFMHSPSDGSSAGVCSSSEQVQSSNVASATASTTPSSANDPCAIANRKKRNKCSPEQFRQLEAFFAKNRNPTGKVREELARRIQMPERSVQVWFQNKRAKTKLLEIKEGIPPEQRSTVSKPKPQPRSSGGGESGASRRKKPAAQATGGPTEPVIQLPVTSLCIGQWRRIKPLICLFSRRNQSFTWYLSSESVGFKLECPRTCINRVIFSGPRDPTMHEFGEGIKTQIGHLIVELDRPPQFYMEVFRSSGSNRDEESGARQQESQRQPSQRASWRQCSDFTEGKQATSVFTHVVSGPYQELRQMVVQLYESGGTTAQMVEFQDAGATAGQSPIVGSWSTSGSSRLAHGQEQSELTAPAEMHSFPSAQLVQHHPGMSSHCQQPSSGGCVMAGSAEEGYYSTLGQWASWRPDNGGHDPSPHPMSQQTAIQQQQQQQQQHLLIPVANAGGVSGTPSPHSASALDLAALRIDTSGISNMDTRSLGGQGQIQGLGAAQHAFTAPWPHTATHAYPDWGHLTGNAGTQITEGDRLSTTEGMQIASGIASAPAYQIHSFATQQGSTGGQLHQSHLLAFNDKTDASGQRQHSGSASQYGGGLSTSSGSAHLGMQGGMFSQPSHVAAAAAAVGFTHAGPTMDDNELAPSGEQSADTLRDHRQPTP